MTHSVILPNGFTMTGVPDDATQAQIAAHAVQKGYAVANDFADYPEAYKAAGGDAKAMDAIQQMENFNPSTVVKVAKENPQAMAAGVGLALAPVTAGLSLPTAYAIDSGSQLALDSAAHAVETGGKDAFPEHPFQDVILPIPGVASLIAKPVSAVAGKIVAPVLERFTPSAVQYLKGRLGHVDLPEDVANAEKYTDEAPISAAGSEQEAEKAVKAAKVNTDRIDAMTAQQAQWMDTYNQKIARRLVGVEAESYILNVIRPEETGRVGESAEKALQTFRSFTEDYENHHLPFPGEERPELSGYGQFEQVMRAEHEPTNAIINRIDAGEEVPAQQLYDSIASYINGTKFDLEQFLTTAPHVNIKRLLTAVKEAPGITEWLDAKGIMNPETRSYVSAKQAAAHRAGISDAYSASMERLNNELTKERGITSAEYQEARAAGERSRQTALEHKIKLLNNMQKNVKSIMNDAAGIKGEATWKDISEDERAVYWAMTHTHDAAQRGAKAMRMYEQMEAVRAALPGVRASTAMDRVTDNAASTVMAGFMMGGVPGAIAAPIVKAAGERAKGAVVRRVVNRAERAELIAAANKSN
ncbi:hypothetical protein [Kluyvera sp. CHPC 1.2972]|uniref:hypothetical protein n=1 Tax=Kluyvera sp. CHPC 1.2972 TaxID=2995176 RepID=UPI002FD860FF